MDLWTWIEKEFSTPGVRLGSPFNWRDCVHVSNPPWFQDPLGCMVTDCRAHHCRACQR